MFITELSSSNGYKQNSLQSKTILFQLLKHIPEVLCINRFGTDDWALRSALISKGFPTAALRDSAYGRHAISPRPSRKFL